MIKGKPRSFHKKFKFGIEFPRFGWSGFAKCSELSAQVTVIKHFEGGALIPFKSPGKVEIPALTLERGATKDVDCFNWFNSVVNIVTQLGDIDEEYKDDGDVVQFDRDGTTLRRWGIVNAWPSAFTAGDWDNSADEVVIEKLVLDFDHFFLAA